ncbi:Sodium-coupled monocarboxylate transporter 2 [Eumeta japonica]|uniref:Sodium-coupled monocarboxylate transporter 2 n=1 Tax=Eumeta variegata TaxID=151549 RepID=A0A4C1WE80_EUMVA|nr:Sodium-coupled monocarboxylate transporter 2 [Eumeta japonica]
MKPAQVTTSPIYFNVAEYCLFGIILGVILGIIVYYNFINRKHNTVAGFLYGGRNMSLVSTTLALIASHITSITLLGVPLEIYLRGTQYWASALSLVIVTILTASIYLPVFHKLQLTSSFEYLEIRFSAHTRTIAAVLFVVSKLMLLPIVPHVPLLAFRLVTNPLAGRTTALLCVCCATLCASGGLRAVATLGTMTVCLAFVGTSLPSGLALLPMGFDTMWGIANNGSRLVFYDPDPELAHHTSFFAVTLALSTHWLWKVALNQSSIQNLLAVPTINQARMYSSGRGTREVGGSSFATFPKPSRSLGAGHWDTCAWPIAPSLCLVMSCVGVILMKLMSCILGLVLYAWYASCDPLLSGQIRKHEQLVPNFLNNLSTLFPGICGIFIIAVFSATTGCLSSIINSISGVIFEEFFRPWLPQGANEATCCKIMRLLCILVGVYCGAVVWSAAELDRLQHVASGVTGVTAGTLLGLFTLGIVFSRANCAGALSGSLLSLMLCGWLLIGAENALASGALKFQGKPLSTEGCAKTGAAQTYYNMTNKHPNIMCTKAVFQESVTMPKESKRARYNRRQIRSEYFKHNRSRRIINSDFNTLIYNGSGHASDSNLSPTLDFDLIPFSTLNLPGLNSQFYFTFRSRYQLRCRFRFRFAEIGASSSVKIKSESSNLSNIEHRAVIKYFVKKGKTPKEIFEDMVSVLQKSAPSYTMVKKMGSLISTRTREL